MKIVRLTLATTVAMALTMASISVYGEDAPTDAKVEAAHRALSCHGGCHDGCGAPNCRHTCKHGFRNGHCKHGCVSNHYGYGRMQICPGKQNGICPVHGYGACPHQREPFGPALRQALTPADRPYFGTQPMMAPPASYGPEGYGPGPQPLFPRVRAWFWRTPEPRYMTTAPAPPQPTYTTRGPRDFLNPNPPSIGY